MKLTLEHISRMKAVIQRERELGDSYNYFKESTKNTVCKHFEFTILGF